MSAHKQCPGCGRLMGADDRFCSSCGTALDGAAPRAAVAPRRGQSRRPGLDELFAHLRSGEQRPATILMSDLAGFSTLGETADPEWVFNLINEIFAELVECLVAHGGHVDKFVGDEVMALFGVPVAQERSVDRALRAALAMHERLREMNREGRFGAAQLGMHTGINMGPVMVGPVGHRDLRADYTVIGDAVNVTKRLEDEAPAGEIYVSETVRTAVGDHFEFEPVGLLTLAGRRQRVNVYRLLGARATPRHHATHDKSGTPLLGREKEIQTLRAAFRTTVSDGQAALCVGGPAGIGKSRLIAEWRRSEEADRFSITSVACHAFGEHFPLLPIIEIITQLAGLRLEGWPPRVNGQIDAEIGKLETSSEARRAITDLLQGIGSSADVANAAWRGALTTGIIDLLHHVCRQQPCCLVIEDMQWLDEVSRGIMTDVFAAERSAPFHLMLSAREGGMEWCAGTLGAEPLQLPPLPRPAMEQLVAVWAAPTVLPRDTIHAICDRAEGHPYFARELVRSLHRTNGGAAEIMPDSGVRLPDTLQELFLAQLDSLARPLRHLVQGASVVGEPLSCTLLQAAMGEESHTTFAVLTNAVQQGLLRAAPTPGQFTFGRRLLFEAAYNTIPPTQRQEVHARVATHLLERLDRLGEAAVHVAAHHTYLGYRDERAIEPLLRSARQYRSQYSNRQAIEDAHRAVEIISSLPQPTEFLEQRLEALLFLSQSYEVIGDLGHADGTIAEAEILADDCTNDEIVAQIATAAATLRLMQGQREEAAAGFSRARDAWERIGNEMRVAHTLLGMGICAQQQSDRTRAVVLFREAAERCGDALWVKAAALNNAGMVRIEEGQYDEAEALLLEGLAANEAADDKRGVAHSKASLGELCYRQARFETATDWLTQARESGRSIEDAQCVAQATALLVRVRALQGDGSGAAQLLAEIENPIALDDPELAAVVKLAELEAMHAQGYEIAAPDETAADDDGTPADATPGTNRCAEVLCVLLENAIIHGCSDAAAAAQARLSHCVATVPDMHLRHYAAYLLELAAGDTDPTAPADQDTVFAVRRERLLRSLTDSNRSQPA